MYDFRFSHFQREDTLPTVTVVTGVTVKDHRRDRVNRTPRTLRTLRAAVRDEREIVIETQFARNTVSKSEIRVCRPCSHLTRTFTRRPLAQSIRAHGFAACAGDEFDRVVRRRPFGWPRAPPCSNHTPCLCFIEKHETGKRGGGGGRNSKTLHRAPNYKPLLLLFNTIIHNRIKIIFTR